MLDLRLRALLFGDPAAPQELVEANPMLVHAPHLTLGIWTVWMSAVIVGRF